MSESFGYPRRQGPLDLESFERLDEESARYVVQRLAGAGIPLEAIPYDAILSLMRHALQTMYHSIEDERFPWMLAFRGAVEVLIERLIEGTQGQETYQAFALRRLQPSRVRVDMSTICPLWPFC